MVVDAADPAGTTLTFFCSGKLQFNLSRQHFCFALFWLFCRHRFDFWSGVCVEARCRLIQPHRRTRGQFGGVGIRILSHSSQMLRRDRKYKVLTNKGLKMAFHPPPAPSAPIRGQTGALEVTSFKPGSRRAQPSRVDSSEETQTSQPPL